MSIVTPANKERFLMGIAIDLEEALVRAAPNSKDTADKKGEYAVGGGHLARNIRCRVEGDGIKVSMPDYWVYVEFGSPPHIIRPKSGKALAWGKPQGKTAGGATKRENVFSVVHHPGTKPQRWVTHVFRTEFVGIVTRNAHYLVGQSPGGVA